MRFNFFSSTNLWRSTKLCLLLILFSQQLAQAKTLNFTNIDLLLNQHESSTGVLILERGEQALLARAWLADHAEKTIEVQYFIWSTDNIGILATEALLRAANRGVYVRVIVDDLMIKAPDETLLALALHPKIDIKIYNPKHSVGTPWFKRLLNVLTDFRGVNQRMHDKTFIVDGKIAITGGRNMADEYFDFDHKYNFRDRDALLLGQVVPVMQESFNLFWNNKLSIAVEEQFNGIGLLKENVTVNDSEIQQVYNYLTEYAGSESNFEPEIKAAIKNILNSFELLIDRIVWGDVEFISDKPGKNNELDSFDGSGDSTRALAALIKNAKKSILIQSPYLVLSDRAFELFRAAIKRGVKIIISTNSLASTDNLSAYSGYEKQREEILKAGITVYEYMPYPSVQKQLLERYHRLKKNKPVFALHAKTMIIDAEVLYIGTYNLDPRSENLNTEVGIVVLNKELSSRVIKEIEVDMAKENSWKAQDNPNQHASFFKRFKLFFYKLLPLKPIL